MSDINLLPKQNGFSLRQEQSIALFRRISLIILSVTAFSSVVIFILVLASPLSKSQQEEQSLIQVLSKANTKLSRNIIIQERLTSIQNILKTRGTYEKSVNDILEQVPSSIAINSITVATKSMQVSGNSSSLDDTNTLFTNLTQLKNQKKSIKSITVRSLTLQTSNAKYYFIMDIALL